MYDMCHKACSAAVFLVLISCHYNLPQEPSHNSSQLSGIQNQQGEHLMLWPCAEDTEKSAFCTKAASSDATEGLPPRFTFVLCQEPTTPHPSPCAPVFWSQEGSPLALRFTPESLGEESALRDDLSGFADELKQQSHDSLWATTFTAGGSLVAFLLNRATRFSNSTSKPTPLFVLATTLAAVSVGHYLFSAFRKPVVQGSMLGKTTGRIPQPGYAGYLLPQQSLSYYEPDAAELSFIENAQLLLNPQASQVASIHHLGMGDITATLAQWLIHYGAADTSSLARVCLPQEGGGLACSASSAEDTLGADHTPNTVIEDWRQQLAQHSAQNQPNGGAPPSPLLDQNGNIAAFGGLPYGDFITPSSHESCPSALELSSAAEDPNLYVAEGYFKCLLSGGGEACASTYNCNLKPKDHASCLALTRGLALVISTLDTEKFKSTCALITES